VFDPVSSISHNNGPIDSKTSTSILVMSICWAEIKPSSSASNDF
jgi:hypothetical protein